MALRNSQVAAAAKYVEILDAKLKAQDPPVILSEENKQLIREQQTEFLGFLFNWITDNAGLSVTVNSVRTNVNVTTNVNGHNYGGTGSGTGSGSGYGSIS